MLELFILESSEGVLIRRFLPLTDESTELSTPVVLIEHLVGHVLQLLQALPQLSSPSSVKHLHVLGQQELPQGDEVAVLLLLYVHRSPRVLPSSVSLSLSNTFIQSSTKIWVHIALLSVATVEGFRVAIGPLAHFFV